MRLRFQFLQKTSLWWKSNRKWLKGLFWINILIWFWPVYFGIPTYKEIVTPNEITFAQIVRTFAPTPSPMPDTILDTINYYAKIFGVNPDLAVKITTCESNNNPDRIGNEEKSNLNSVGLWQFQPTTFYANAANYKMKNANIYDYRDQTIIAMQMIRDGKIGEWSCYKKIK